MFFSANDLMIDSYVKMSEESKYACLSCGNWSNVDQNCMFPWQPYDFKEIFCEIESTTGHTIMA